MHFFAESENVKKIPAFLYREKSEKLPIPPGRGVFLPFSRKRGFFDPFWPFLDKIGVKITRFLRFFWIAIFGQKSALKLSFFGLNFVPKSLQTRCIFSIRLSLRGAWDKRGKGPVDFGEVRFFACVSHSLTNI